MSNRPMLFVDCFGNLTEAQVKAFQRSGIDGIIAYLCYKTHPQWGKGLTLDSLQMYKGLGWKVCFNFEGDPTSKFYFVPDQGKRDAHDVLTEFDYLGIKPDPQIDAYFSVDYDVEALSDMQAIDRYFVDVEEELKGGFSDAVYGSDSVLTYLFSKNARSKPKKGWQTVGWSGGRLFNAADLYQYRIDATIDGVQVDVSKVLASPGYWPVDPPVLPIVKPLKYRVVTNTFDDVDKASQAAMQISQLGYVATVEEAK